MGTLKYVPVKLTKKQIMVVMCRNIEEVLLDGSKGSGKTVALLANALYDADQPNERCIFIRNNYKDMVRPGGMLDVMKRWMANYPEVKFIDGRYFKMPSGAEYHFGHLGDEGSQNYIQGSEWTKINYDEAVYLKPNFVDDVNACLRTSGKYEGSLQIRYASNPANTPMGAILKKRFVKSPPTKHTFRIPMQTDDNVHLHDINAYKRRLAAIADPVRRQQLMDGSWDAISDAAYFFTPNIKFIEPGTYDVVKRVRGWDMAGFTRKGDYTVGVLMSMFYVDEENEDGNIERFKAYIVEDVVRGRWEETEGMTQLSATHLIDDINIPYYIEEEIGGNGAWLIASLKEGTLRGRNIHGSKAQADSKEGRAAGIKTALWNKRLYFVKAPWNEALREEMNMFPSAVAGQHDDQIDAMAHAQKALDAPIPGIYLI